jgi:hypothetical protein
MKNLLKLSAATALVFAFNSCCKEGTGGDATLVVFLKHHGFIIENHVNYPDTVYVKFNAKEAPKSLGDYDTKFVGEAGENHVHCEGLKCGDYYIFGGAMDTTGPYRVTGGMHVKIKHKDRKDEQDIDLAVSE